MRNHIIILITAIVLLNGCASSMKVYTFKKERVDQELKGNEGFVEGGKPEKKDSRSTKRTLIGIDIELDTEEAISQPDSKTQKIAQDKSKAPVAPAKKETSIPEEASKPLKDKQIQLPEQKAGEYQTSVKHPNGAETIVVEKTVIDKEEDWIK